MKLTTKLRTGILKAYQIYWEAYLKGDMKTFASLMDDKVSVFGTAVSEVFKNKKETVRFYKATADQMTGKAQFRKRNISLQPADNVVILKEECDLYFLIEKKWTFYGHARITAILQQAKAGWKLIHQHASFPDSRAEQGEQVAANKIKKENLALREAIQRRTVELEEKNRELEIETALEKVRSVAMGMKNPGDMLKVCKIISQQLTKLGIKEIRNVQTAIINKEKGIYLNYEFFPKAQKQIISPVEYNKQKDVKAFANKILSDKNAFFARSFNSKKLKDWIAYQRKSKQFVDPYTVKARSLHYYFYSIGSGALGISTYAPLGKEDIKLFKRFRNVFELTYKRFVDIEKANAQAKEAQIEVAVERVRAKALAMHRSEEIHAVVRTLHNELLELRLEGITGVTICLKQDDGQVRLWDITDLETTGRYGWDLLFDMDKIDPQIWVKKIWNSDKRIIAIEQDSNDLKRTLKWLSQYDKKTADGITELLRMNKIKHGWNRAVKLSRGVLITDFINEPPAEIDNILLKIGAAFDLAYKRFLDLKNAEAQAKEARIEAALERVRSKTMAMHKSEELSETVNLLFHEFQEFGGAPEQLSIGIIKEEEDVMEMWVTTSANRRHPLYKCPLREPAPMKKTYEAWKDQKKSVVIEIKGKELKEYADFRKVNYNSEVADDLKYGRRILNIAFFSKGMIALGAHEPRTTETLQLLERFAAVFDLTYTRFLDLQKAEAQTREAKIEAGLERVRGRAMAMQSSDELNVLIGTVFQELTKLDLILTRCVIWIIDKETNSAQWWMANSEDANNPGGFKIKYHEAHPWVTLLNEWKKQTVKYVYDLHGQIKKDWDDFLFSETELVHLPKIVQDGMRAPERILLSVSFNNFGGINVASLHPLTDEHFDILLRFAKVFDLTYTRFNDLKQAEAQAREAKIEAALERVRSRTMAMHKSDELAEVVAVIYRQFEELDFGLYQVLVSIFDTRNKITEWWSKGFENVALPQRNIIPHIDHPFTNDILDKWKKGIEYYPHILEGDIKKSWEEYLFTQTDLKHFPEEVKTQMRGLDKVYLSDVFMKYGSLQAAGPVPLPDDKAEILKRFVKVLDLAYTRMIDLQNAEAQAKEAKIEAALERVRSRAMAMHSSNELNDVALELRNQMGQMAQPELEVCAIHLYDESPDHFEAWAAARPPGHQGEVIPLQARFPIRGVMIVDEMMKAYHEGKKDYVLINEGEKLSEWLGQLNKQVPEGYKIVLESLNELSPEDRRTYWSMADFQGGSLVMTTYIPAKEESRNLLRRFANVFGLAYRRFVDLKQAEAQAREAQIELGLERVRARAMAMQRSDELKDLIATLSIELGKLDIVLDRCFIITYDIQTMGSTWWMANPETPVEPIGLFVKYHEQSPYLAHIEAWRNREIKWQYILEGKTKKEWDKFLFAETELSLLPPPVIENMRSQQKVYLSSSFNNFGYLSLATLEPLSNEQFDIMLRFAKVFDLTYTRFSDLKQAESQARESQIQLALERVRARTMAMHKSNELLDVITLVGEQVSSLNIRFDNVSFGIKSPGNDFDFWMAGAGQPQPIFFHAPYIMNPVIDNVTAAQQKGIGSFADLIGPADNRRWLEHLFATNKFEISADTREYLMNSPGFSRTNVLRKNVNFFVGNYHAVPYSKEENDIFIRFAVVFEQSYTRFLDLQKAEAQAREAQIEAALEKVRSRTMAMQSSNELQETAAVLFTEFKKLGTENIYQVTIGIYNEEAGLIDFRVTSWAGSGEQENRTFNLSMNEPTVLQPAVAAWKAGKTALVIDLTGKVLEGWLSYRNKMTGVKVTSKDTAGRRVISIAYFSKGHLSISTPVPVPLETIKILERFATVFDGTYTRFLDLEKAEAQAKEARIEASLERVRSKAMAMHNSQDLADTIGDFYKELSSFSMTPRRCGVGLLNKQNKEGELFTWNTTEQGESLELVGKIKMEGHPVLENVYKGWVSQTDYYPVLRGNEIKEYYKIIRPMIAFPDYHHDQVQYGYFFFFKEGGVYAWTEKEMKEDEVQIYRRFTSVLSLTYKRYKDLQQAEALAEQARLDLIQIQTEKKRAEDALTELQSAQRQLVQSEKMASLGELTAGIAHEIQNPLNFVNNFSEVSTELIKEMVDEVEKGNTEEVKAIATDLIGNLEKINHHGKRADGIVKGMLQHSRSSTGQKELTDINALCDEYLRLAYHGLRAKDKSFNAKFETHFDEAVSKVNVIPQDIGRVILNLINNAFYAVSEKRKTSEAGYEATVSVSTKKENDKILITVSDNGDGIPKEILDKIFQPFFTTKPTGSGTGLGLSLSYDIIKAHGGEIFVDSETGKGSEFIIKLSN